MKRALLLLSLIVSLAWLAPHLGAQRSRRPAVDPDAVQPAARSRPAGENPGVKGATYYALEARTNRLTTEFTDGTRAVAERGPDGDLLARLEGQDRNELNRVRVDRNDGAADVAELTRPLAEPVGLLMRGDVHPTLDWAARQSHQFEVDGTSSADGLRWQDGLARRRGGAKEVHELQSVRSITTEWADGLSAITGPVHAKPGDRFQGRPVRGDVLVTKLVKDGVQVGLANYLTHEQIFTWSIGTSSGAIGPDELASRYGGWLFTPDIVWMNLQAIGLYEWKTAIDRDQFVARAQTPPSAAGRLLQFFEPTVSANEPGCDGLHWLDGTVLRYCCDIHDQCYEKYGCSSSSWWQFWSNWICDACNGAVVFCFAAASGVPYTQSPW